ncbi:YicC/YloC family endoribonuclease [Roseisalinus antarcticus]|nr:YicC/YloC family endoribonuclease [Roseisalinus antarcticus]
MTAFASRSGSVGTTAWAWEVRGVNARGLDLRLRLPDGVPGLEALVRPRLTARLGRGSITLSLRLDRQQGGPELVLDPVQLDRVLDTLARIEARALESGLTLAQPNAADVMSVRGVVATAVDDAVDKGLTDALMADLEALIDAFDAMRRGEGAALQGLISGQLDTIVALLDEADTVVEARRDETRASMATALRRVFEDVPEADEPRLMQELALIAVKQDVTEEIDRLRTHVDAARALLAEDAPAGRRLDFLAQEFNRESNTLCSKAQNKALTGVGLALKAAIEQMREQIQNVE